MTSSYLDRLEAAAIRILREVVAEAERPVMLPATDRESAVLRRLAEKAFFPAPPPFPLPSVDAGGEAGGEVGFDLAITGGRGDPGKDRRPEVWQLVNTRRRKGETISVSPLADWTELDLQRYLDREGLANGAAGAPPAQPDKVALCLNVCGGPGAGKSALVRCLLSARGASDGASARSFSTDRRDFRLVDSAADGQDARAALAAASNVDLSVLVVDAQAGLTTPTRRHLVLLSLLGVRPVVVAINKMDLVGGSQAAFAAIERELRAFAAELNLSVAPCLPIAATSGDNVHVRAGATPWYDGPTLLELLDTVRLDEAAADGQPLRLPVEWVHRDGPAFRGFAGAIVGGRLKKGDPVRVQPSGRIGRVARISTYDGDLAEAGAGQTVAIVFEGELAVGRGDLIVPANEPAEVADQFEATIIWMRAAPMLRGRGYLLKIGPQTVTATIGSIKYRINVNTLERMAGATLGLNEIGVCNVQVDRAIAFDPYRANHETGGFILIDRVSNETVGAGMLQFALRRAQNVHWQALDVNKAARSAIKRQRACVLWYTGLSGAGKSTIANLVDKKLHAMNRHTYLLDGDNVRHGLNKDLGFTDADRVENIRRIGEVAKLMVDAGLIVSTAFISPFRAERMMARALVEQGEFIEIFIDTPLGVAEGRDPKGLYKKARRGDLKNFTGIDSPYEGPESPELRIDTTTASPEEAAETIVAYLHERGVLA